MSIANSSSCIEASATENYKIELSEAFWRSRGILKVKWGEGFIYFRGSGSGSGFHRHLSGAVGVASTAPSLTIITVSPTYTLIYNHSCRLPPAGALNSTSGILNRTLDSRVGVNLEKYVEFKPPGDCAMRAVYARVWPYRLSTLGVHTNRQQEGYTYMSRYND